MARLNRRAGSEARKSQAEARQKARDARSAEEQLALLDQRPGFSAKERKRLEALIVQSSEEETT